VKGRGGEKERGRKGEGEKRRVGEEESGRGIIHSALHQGSRSSSSKRLSVSLVNNH